MMQETGRRLAAVMFTDIVGYGVLAERDEALALELLNEHQQILRRIFPSFGGKEIKATGDGFLAEFGSVMDATNCAIAIQTTLFERNLSVDEERQIQIRIGLHLGDVVEFEQDRYGTGVNIAARIEPFAPPGGISLSQQVFDQVSAKIDLPIRKMGKLRLKNIREPLSIYRVLLPWEPQGRDVFRRVFRGLVPSGLPTPQGALLGALVCAVLLTVAFVFAKLWFPVTLTVDRGATRSIASEAPTQAAERQLILPKDWEYALGSDEEAGTKWLPFDVARTISYADELDGDYLLRLRFIGAGGFRHPALVLGLISDVHRAYLNGKFVGGSERFSDVGIYSFDPSLIKPGEINTIFIKARTRHSFSPGINLLPGLTPMIGEFEDVTQKVTRNQISFRLLRPISLAVSLLLALASLCYYLVRRTDLRFLYYSCFLLLGSLCLAYYNTFVLASVSYPFYRFIKLFSIGISSFVLFSYYLGLRGLKRLETANNLAALVVCASSAMLLLGSAIPASRYIARYNGILETLVAYTAAWLGTLLLRGAIKLSKPAPLRSIDRTQVAEVSIVVIFGLAIGMLCYSSTMTTESGIISLLARAKFRDVALIYPFLFALMVLARGIADYTRKSQDVSYKRRKDDFMLSIANLAAYGPPGGDAETISAIQSRVAEFLKAARSTIYLLEAKEGQLVATYSHGPVGAEARLKKVIPASSGIIGYCLERKSPVFVENIQKDPRFRGLSAANSGEFRTGSFMVFPLVLGSQVLGAITIADRIDGRPFTREDFCLMHLIAKDIALLVSHSQLQRSAVSPVSVPMKSAS